MLAQVLLFFLLLVLLFLLCRKITNYIYAFFFLITRNRKFSIGAIALIFLPGTFLHEFSHLAAAALLRVGTGELTIFPEVDDSKEVKTGRLYIAKTDPFRHTLIGLAPMLIGLTIIYFIGKILLPNLKLFLPITDNRLLKTILAFYLFFIVSTTMFSSKKDLESLIIVFPITFIFVLALYYTGIRVVFEPSLLSKISILAADLNFILFLCAVLNLLVYLFLAFNLFFWQKILRRKIKF